MIPICRISDPHFYADPDPGKNLHADPDPEGKGKIIFFRVFFRVLDNSKKYLKNFEFVFKLL